MTAEPATSACRERLARWVNQHGLAVRGYLRSLTGRPDLADDLAQEVFQRAWLARDRYVDRGQERAYLLTIADRLACDHFRRSSPELSLDVARDAGEWRTLEPTAPTFGPLERLMTAERSTRIQEALQKLSPAQRRVLLLRFYGEMSFQDIADSIDSPLNTVLSHCRRGLLTLRQLLREDLL